MAFRISEMSALAASNWADMEGSVTSWQVETLKLGVLGTSILLSSEPLLLSSPQPIRNAELQMSESAKPLKNLIIDLLEEYFRIKLAKNGKNVKFF